MYLYIDSSKRSNHENTQSTNFNLNLNKTITITKYIKLLSCIIPKTIYLINEKNNNFKIKFNDNTEFNILIPINNYTPEELALYIKNIVNYSNFNVVYDTNKFIFTFSANQNFILNFTLSEFCYLFNLSKLTYLWNNNLFNTKIINFNNPIQFFININEIDGTFISNNNIISNFIVNFNVERMGVLSYFSNINYEQINYVDKTYNLNSLKVQILDKDNNILDLNNWDIFLILEYK